MKSTINNYFKHASDTNKEKIQELIENEETLDENILQNTNLLNITYQKFEKNKKQLEKDAKDAGIPQLLKSLNELD